MYINKLFVFGTLLPGLDNYNRFIKEHQPQIYQARTRGTMYYLPQDDYPVVLDGDGEVKGVLFEAPGLRVAIPQIDDIQKYTGVYSQSHLVREIRDVENLETGEIIKAHMYLWPCKKADWLKKNGTVIIDGDWAKFLQNRKTTS